ncbi:MAG TPA: hypothetical protein VME23_22165 [Terracidiphilus sp.]|nr:hypothetical protein [Terracidiphilus sp.]
MSKVAIRLSMALVLAAGAAYAPAAQLSTDARGAIPHDVQQLVVIDYRAMQNSTSAMDLRNRVMPPELKQFDEALQKSGLNDNHDVDELAFALFRTKPDSDTLDTVGIAQGQFDVQSIMAGFKKNKVKPTVVRTNNIYPMTKAGMMLCFVDPSTMVFGEKEAVEKALDARDGISQSMLSNNNMMNAMQSVDSNPLWSILDQKGTQTMMMQLLGSAGSAGTGADFNTVNKKLESSWYSMDFQHGVKFDLTISTGDPFTASTLSSLMTAAVMVRKMSSTDTEKQALNATSISASAGQLTIDYTSTDNQFSSLLQSPLFGTMVR